MRYILTLDIGGTNPRMAIVEILSENNFKIIEKINISNNCDSIINPINDFLEELGNKNITTDTCCISIAGTVENNSCLNPPNANFLINEKEIIENTMIKNLLVINDFKAIGNAISVLDIDESLLGGKIIQIKKGAANKKGNRAILGPGTGLGISYLIKNDNDFIVFASEGGNSPISQLEDFNDFFDFLRKDLCLKQISAEVLVSGQGIRFFFEYFSKKNICLDDKRILEVLENEKKGIGDVDGAEIISKYYDSNKNAKLALDSFRDYLIIAAQGVALNGLSTGGLFIAGGIVSKNLNLFDDVVRTKELFINNWKQRELLKKIPIYIIKDYDISFYGCAKAAVEKFGF